MRDDGFGNRRDEPALFLDFSSEPAIVLLGDPGMGKSTQFRIQGDGTFRTVRTFLIDPAAPFQGNLYLDGLDEYRSVSPGQSAIDVVAKELCRLERPRFRLSCRSADWYGTSDHEALNAASSNGRIVVLELCALSDAEIKEAAKALVPDGEAFLGEARSSGVADLLGNPQTLEMIARAWSGTQKPRNKFDAYDLGVRELLKETNSSHTRRDAIVSNLKAARDCAGTACLVMLLSNSAGISRIDGDSDGGFVLPCDLPQFGQVDLAFALKSRLFVSHEADRFEPVHRTVAEFLAAESLVKLIHGGLPPGRVMSMICGPDGKPVSSLRGLYAWLACHLRESSGPYVSLDPYAIVAYGDPSSIPEVIQRQVWKCLQDVDDPWFLSSTDDRSTFSQLANKATSPILSDILKSRRWGQHLRIAALEAISNSEPLPELGDTVLSLVHQPTSNTWLKCTAVKAYAKCVNLDSVKLLDLDIALSLSEDDDSPEVRLALVEASKLPDPVDRVLSILKQASLAQRENHVIGRLYGVLDLIPDERLDAILDASEIASLARQNGDYEIPSLFSIWLKRRLRSEIPLQPTNLATWLQYLSLDNQLQEEGVIQPLTTALSNEQLFRETVDALIQRLPNEPGAFWYFFAHEIWGLMPIQTWPLPYQDFLLGLASRLSDERAADLVRILINRFDSSDSIEHSERLFSFIDSRNDVDQALGEWRSQPIPEWKIEEWSRKVETSMQLSETRSKNEALLTPKLSSIRSGEDIGVLLWALPHYFGWHSCKEQSPQDRLTALSTPEISTAILDGYFNYLDQKDIPPAADILAQLKTNSVKWHHSLVALSVALRWRSGTDVPDHAFLPSVAAAVTSIPFSNRNDELQRALVSWLVAQLNRAPDATIPILTTAWGITASSRDYLPLEHELVREPMLGGVLARAAKSIIGSRAKIGDSSALSLARILLRHDMRMAAEVATEQLQKSRLGASRRSLWLATLFIAEPNNASQHLGQLSASARKSLWPAIDLVGGERTDRSHFSLTQVQRAALVGLLGGKFASCEYPTGGWHGSHNDWDASSFVSGLIKAIASSVDEEAEALLAMLEGAPQLGSYRPLIKHQRAQLAKALRDTRFTFPTPSQVSSAIRHGAPVSAADLAQFVISQLELINKDLSHTQREQYRAYWNEIGKKLDRPKHEEVCSGILAGELKLRIGGQNLTVTVEHHMSDDKECDLMVLQGNERQLPIEVKHHYHAHLWSAWRDQLDDLYTKDPTTAGFGIYVVLWSGEATGRRLPSLPAGMARPSSSKLLQEAIESLIPAADRHRLLVCVLDISGSPPTDH